MADDEPREPSIFETPDTPAIEDGDVDPPEYNSEYIISEQADIETARSIFDTSEVNNRLTDFEQLRKTGWRVSKRGETRAEKLTRLRREIQELRSEDPGDEGHEDMLSDLQTLSNISIPRPAVLSPGKVASQISLESIERMSLLETRLGALESRIGTTTSVSLAKQIEIMRKKVATISSSDDILEQRTQRLRLLSEEAKDLQQSDAAIKLSELYQRVDEVTKISPNIPSILSRLKSLHEIHQDAGEAQARLNSLRSSLASNSEEISAWKATLEAVESQVQTGGSTMIENLAALQAIAARFEAETFALTNQTD